MNASEQVEKLYNKIQVSCNDTLADFKYRYLTDKIEIKRETLKGFILSFIEFGEDVNSCTALIHLNRQKHPQKMFDFLEVLDSHNDLIFDYLIRIKQLTDFDDRYSIFKKQGTFEIDKGIMLYWEFQRKFLNQSESLEKVISGLRIIETCDWLDSERQSVQDVETSDTGIPADDIVGVLKDVFLRLTESNSRKLLSDLLLSKNFSVSDIAKYGKKPADRLKDVLKEHRVKPEIWKSVKTKDGKIFINSKKNSE